MNDIWEYKRITPVSPASPFADAYDKTFAQFIGLLNEAGAEGWEVVAAQFPGVGTMNALLKRRRAPAQSTPVATSKTYPTDSEISTRCLKLADILDDPHPGLVTWQEARREAAASLHAALTLVLIP